MGFRDGGRFPGGSGMGGGLWVLGVLVDVALEAIIVVVGGIEIAVFRAQHEKAVFRGVRRTGGRGLNGKGI